MPDRHPRAFRHSGRRTSTEAHRRICRPREFRPRGRQRGAHAVAVRMERARAAARLRRDHGRAARHGARRARAGRPGRARGSGGRHASRANGCATARPAPTAPSTSRSACRRSRWKRSTGSTTLESKSDLDSRFSFRFSFQISPISHVDRRIDSAGVRSRNRDDAHAARARAGRQGRLEAAREVDVARPARDAHREHSAMGVALRSSAPSSTRIRRMARE